MLEGQNRTPRPSVLTTGVAWAPRVAFLVCWTSQSLRTRQGSSHLAPIPGPPLPTPAPGPLLWACPELPQGSPLLSFLVEGPGLQSLAQIVERTFQISSGKGREGSPPKAHRPEVNRKWPRGSLDEPAVGTNPSVSILAGGGGAGGRQPWPWQEDEEVELGQTGCWLTP